MTESLKLLVPIFLTATLTLVGWMSLEVVTHKSDIAVINERISTIQSDISTIKEDLHTLVTAKINNNEVEFIVKN